MAVIYVALIKSEVFLLRKANNALSKRWSEGEKNACVRLAGSLTVQDAKRY